VSRHAGVSIPLFSAGSTSSWGTGEIEDIAPLSAWLSAAGFDRLMLLPIGTMDASQTSPYSASSAMAIDSLFVSIERLSDFVDAGGRLALSAAARDDLASRSVDDRLGLVVRDVGTQDQHEFVTAHAPANSFPWGSSR
jgi:4-alpha-glucanotransferase